MTALDIFCAVMFAIGLALIGLVMFRQAYRRANPKPRAPLTSWQEGRRG